MKGLFVILGSLFFLCASTSLNLTNYELIDYRLKYGTFATPTCSGTGLFCHECRYVVYCPNAGGTAIFQEDCVDGKICDESSRTCIKPPSNPSCSPTTYYQFFCSASGLFPDPGDCTKYHFCVPTQGSLDITHTPWQCASSGYGYNPKTTFCDKKLTNGICTGYPIPLCTANQEVGVVKENPTLYYTCLKHPEDPTGAVLYPFINACPNGGIYRVGTGCSA